jgi:hypothetical protein
LADFFIFFIFLVPFSLLELFGVPGGYNASSEATLTSLSIQELINMVNSINIRLTSLKIYLIKKIEFDVFFTVVCFFTIVIFRLFLEIFNEIQLDI